MQEAATIHQRLYIIEKEAFDDAYRLNPYNFRIDNNVLVFNNRRDIDMSRSYKLKYR